MPGRSPLSLFIALFLVLLLVVPAAADPELVCGDIPFGKHVDEVLKVYGGSNVVRQETPYIESIGN